MSKKSDAIAKADKAEQQIEQLLGRRRAGTVTIAGEPVRVRCAGVGRLKRQDNGQAVDPYSCEVFEQKASDQIDLIDEPESVDVSSITHTSPIDACVGHMPNVPSMLAAE